MRNARRRTRIFFFFPRKETTFRLSSPRRPRWCNGSAFALDHFSFFFSLPPPPLPISYLAAPDIRHTFSLLSPPLSLIFSVIRRCLFSLFAPRSQITLLYRPFERSWFGGEKSRREMGRATLWGKSFIGSRGKSFRSAIFLFSSSNLDTTSFTNIEEMERGNNLFIAYLFFFYVVQVKVQYFHVLFSYNVSRFQNNQLLSRYIYIHIYYRGNIKIGIRNWSDVKGDR